MRKKINKKIVILLLFISIGYAFLSAALNINGIIGYKGNRWNIYFDNVNILKNDISAEKPTINNEKNTINFNATFSEPGEVFKFSVDVINDGTLDAMLSEILKTGIDSTNSKYISYTVKYYDDTELNIKDAIKAGSKTRINVEVRYKYETDELAPAGTKDYSIALTYVQATREANYITPMYDSKSNNIFTLNNVKENSLSNLRIYGNTKQKQYQGYQLIKKDGLSTPASDNEFWENIKNSTPLSDGWIRVNYDNTAGTSNSYCNYFIKNGYINLEPDTYYTAFIEYRNLQGQGSITLTQTSMFNSDPFKTATNDGHFILDEVSPRSGNLKMLLQTKSDLTSTKALRGFSAVNPGDSLSLEIRITIVKGDRTSEDLAYEPYVGEIPSPTPDYPQEVNSVTGDSSLKIVGKNMYNPSYRNNGGIPVHGGNFIEENGLFTFTATDHDLYMWVAESPPHVAPEFRGQVFKFNNKTYTATISNPLFTKNYVNYYDENMIPLGWINYSSNSFTFDNSAFAGAKYFSLRFGYENSVAGEVYTATIQLEEGDTATEYEPYKECVYPISLGDIKLNKIDDYKDYIYFRDGNWYFHQEIYKQKIQNMFNKVNDVEKSFYSWQFRDYTYNAFTPFCTHFIGGISQNLLTDFDQINSSNNNIISFNTDSNYFRLYIKYNDGLDALNNVLTNNNVDLYYVLNSSKEELITNTNLISQLDAIRNSNLFDGINHITYESNMDTDISFDYVER